MKANLNPIGIGSVPFNDVNYAIDVILKNFSEIPYWPQLPKLNNHENMYIQFSEGLPGRVIDIEKGIIYVDTSKANLIEEIQEFYENSFSEEKIEYFKISEKYAKGLYEFKKRKIKAEVVKGHVTGPVSFGLTVTDENKKSIIYNNEFKDIITTLISKKAKWQEKFLNEDEIKKIIIFFDEPYMVSYGSAFFNLPENEIIEIFNLCFNEIEGISGIHCCGNTDWSLIFKTSVKLINFDAFGYLDNFLLYTKQIKEFLKNGKFLAWGFVPTDDEKINQITVDDLKNLFDKALNTLLKAGLEKELILENSFITPSCGTGVMKPENAEKVFELTKRLSYELKENYKLI